VPNPIGKSPPCHQTLPILAHAKGGKGGFGRHQQRKLVESDATATTRWLACEQGRH